MDANGFLAEEFDGLYAYVHEKGSFGRPWWEDPQDVNDKNIHSGGNYWAIHGAGHGFLTHQSVNYYPPHNNAAAEWKHSSVAGTFHVVIKCVESYAPSAAPTFSPSLNPTLAPSHSPSAAPSLNPSIAPSYSPSAGMSFIYFVVYARPLTVLEK